MSALTWVFVVAGVACAATWVASLITHDTSWVDRLWSILPEVYIWIFALHSRPVSGRLVALAVLTTIWGARLTFNFARKGGYSGVEDYRWAVLRRSMSRGQFQLFNLFFIVIYQNALLVLIALPAWTLASHGGARLSATDIALSVLFLALLVGETIADEQQWRFHVDKRRRLAAGQNAPPEFLRQGLFRYSRHPNYFFEIAQWWVVYLFAATTGALVQWTVVGAILLSVLFVGSTRFTESISVSKYPAYRQYQREVSAIVPWWPRRRRVDSVVTDAEGG
ncbi:MAG: DUF1295 domain-containing protein [Acidobacteria bacterium]|nr:DUF1295 domain-containing protein [Acidobacteriota bacterium]